MKPGHWDLIAKAHGYHTFKGLLEDWYLTKQWSLEMISNELEVHRTTIARQMEYYGIKVRGTVPFTIPRVEAVNLTVEQIAQKYKVTHSTAWRAKKRGKQTIS